MTENEIRDLLREMRDDPVPSDSLARVRLGLVERIESKPWTQMFAPWKVAFALLAIGFVVLLAVLARPAVRVEKPVSPLIARQIEAPVEEPMPLPVVQPPNKPRLRRVAREASRVHRVTEPTGASVIRIETPDPEVVILLLGE